MRAIAIIPARSGSKGLKNKNIRELNKIPLLSYSIMAAKESNLFDTVMVSTDSSEYADIAEKWGAEVPFLRSKEASSDKATTRDCILEVLENYEKIGKTFSRLMILQPTSPLRDSDDIIAANLLYDQKDALTVVSVCETDHSPLWCNVIGEDLSLSGFLAQENDARRQDLRKFYRINGAIYLHDVQHYKKNESYFDEKCFAYIMKKEKSVDIDDDIDFKIAECLSSMIKNGKRGI